MFDGEMLDLAMALGMVDRIQQGVEHRKGLLDKC
jgi:hypothetical protein